MGPLSRVSTLRQVDRLVALPGRLNLTPRLRGEVDLQGAGGGSESATAPYGIAVFEAEKNGQDGQVNRPFCENERFASTKWSVCRRLCVLVTLEGQVCPP